MVLRGRRRERDELDRQVRRARAGESSVQVLRGEAGVGKTALLDYVAEQAAGCRLARTAGVQSEMELAFAGIHQLCAPFLDGLDGLPAPQRNALQVAFGLQHAVAPDRFLVALAVLGLLADAAERQPLVCLVDDAQWLDRASAQTLTFVARRVLAEGIAMVFAVREPSDAGELAGLPQLVVEGISHSDARLLLASEMPELLDERVRERIVAETRGNPLALLELPRGLTPADLAGRFGLADAGPLSGRIEQTFLRRFASLPSESQRLLLTAAAEPVGDVTLIWRAAERLGIGTDGVGPAEAAGLISLGASLRFRHPLVRSAIYRAAAPVERREVHRALAHETDAEADPDRRAWHRALAASGPDVDVAAELEHSAGRAQERGGLAAAAAFLERAAALTVDPAHRARRALAAAQARHQAGAPEAALALLASTQAGPLDQMQRAKADVLRAQIDFTTNRGRNAPALLLNAAKQLQALDVTLARETYLEALMAAQFAGRLAPEAVTDVAQAARAAPPSPSPRAPDLLLDGIAVMITETHDAAAPLLRRALDAFREGDAVANGGFRWLWLAEEAAQELWDLETWHELAVLQIELVRAAGALTFLPLAFSALICARIYAGELAAAASLIEDQKSATEATGSRLAPYGALILAAWRGKEGDLTALIDTTLAEIIPRGEGIGVSTCQWVSAVLHNGLGRYQMALAAAQQVMQPPRKLDWTINATLPELIEAAAGAGRAEVAQEALEQLIGLTGPSGTDWALGLEARCRALLSEPMVAESLYRDAIERLARTSVRGEHARAHLLYGEWLRREGRRTDAREQLRTAHRMFTDLGIEGFAERARRELPGTGASARTRTTDTLNALTPQEAQIARLADKGQTNPQIGTELFISPRTVEYHLHKVFHKLEISSRRELRQALGTDAGRAAEGHG
jgi:DNA-binding CsgD family transcriptional regulator